jgi:hypothetical protein
VTAIVGKSGGGFAVEVVRAGGRRELVVVRLGHAHAGVLVMLALVGQILADGAALDGVDDFLARTGIWVAAVLFPAGFFLSSAGGGRTEPNRLIVLLYAGAASLTVGVVALGVGLLNA